MLSTGPFPVAVAHAYAGTVAHAHTGLRFPSASNHRVSGWSDKELPWNVALLLAVRFQPLRNPNTFADASLPSERLSFSLLY